MAFNTTNATAVIEQQIYSRFIVENLHDGLLPDTMTRNVTEFGSGDTLNIPVMGTATLQDVSEEVPLTYSAIDTGRVSLTITDYVGDGWSISDVLRQDGYLVEQLHSERAKESTRALQEYFETRFLQAANAAQTAANVNAINSRPHRWVAGGDSATNRIMTLDDFIAMKLSFNKANAPNMGRIALVDGVTEAAFNSITNLVNVSNNPHFEGIVNEGFARDHEFVKNIYGWDVYCSNRLPVLTATEALNASTYGLANDTAEVGDIANIFMCVSSDTHKPIMRAWRQQPKVETNRNFNLKRDEFDLTARFGLGAQRVDTLGVIITNPSTYV